MLLGEPITVQMLIPGGILLALVLIFQILTGKRVIRFKGRTHIKVHTWAAYVMAVVALGHAFLGMALAFGWSLG